MPISVEVNINGQPIETLYIGRLELFQGPEEWHSYVVTSEKLGWRGDAMFYHKYSDGALTCVRKAIEAFELSSDSGEGTDK